MQKQEVRKKETILTLTILVLCILTNGCKKNHEGIVKAAFVPAGYYLPFLIVENDGLLERMGYSIELQRFGDNAEMISLFINGHLDVTAQSCFTMFPIENKHPALFKFIYGQYANSYYFMVPINSKYRSLRDLKGTTIGTWKSPTAVNYIKLLMRKAGLKLENGDFQVQRFSATDLAPALQNGVVSVIFGFDVPLAQLHQTGNFRYLEEDAVSKILPKHLVFNGGGFVSTKLISNNPKKANAIKEALREAISIIRSNPDHVKEVVAQKLSVSEEVAGNTRFDNFTWPNEKLISSAERTLQLLREEGIVKGDFNAQNMFWWGH